MSALAPTNPEPKGDQTGETLAQMMAVRSDGDILQTPLPAQTWAQKEFVGAEPSSGDLLGHYRIVRSLGRGGMSAVYLAVRADDHYEKQVAIKLLAGVVASTENARFAQEVKILASLEHNNIARLIDAGTLQYGQTYLVIEYVDGKAISEYCKDHGLGLRERLQLFLPVCAAVALAHQKLIVHRDLKPNNILVSADGTPKLIDFGIAKLLNEDPASDLTATGMRPMTPDYASPEQILGLPLTMATDVYSLGVVLYELLTRKKPFELTELTLEELLRTVRHNSAAPPSTLFGRGSREAATLSGDLDSIVLKALRKEPEARYQSVGELTADIENYLESRPVLAARGGTAYRTKKFLRRNAGKVAAAAAVAAALLAGTITTSWQAHIAGQERARAESGFADVRQMANSLIFEFYDAINNVTGATGAQKLVVERALQYLDKLSRDAGPDVALQREVAAGYERLGDVQGNQFQANVGNAAGALASYRRAVLLRESVARARSNDSDALRELAIAYLRLADTGYSTGDLPGAIANYRKGLELLPSGIAVQNTDAEAQARAHGRLCVMLLPVGEIDNAIRHCDSGLTINQNLLATSPHDVKYRSAMGVSYATLANAYRIAKRPAEAMPKFHAAIERLTAIVKEMPHASEYRRQLATSHVYLANMLMAGGDLKGAIPNYGEGTRHMRTLAKSDVYDVKSRTAFAYTLIRQAGALIGVGRIAEARRSTLEGLEIFKAVADRPNASADDANNYAEYLTNGEPADLRRPCAAVPYSERAVKLSEDKSIVHLHTLAWAYFRCGNAEAAIKTAERALSRPQPAPAGGLWEQLKKDLNVFRNSIRR